MEKYIDKKAVLDELERVYNLSDCPGEFYNGYRFAMKIVKGFPKAEVEPVRHGRLVETGMDEAWCSWGDCTVCGHSNIMGSHYCNYCGARMGLGGADNA